jgi:diaminopimelate decarboxylase
MIRNPLKNVNGELYVDGVSTLKLAEEFGTPLYVMSERKIRENCRHLYSAFSRRYNKFRVLYSAKANTNLSILKILKSEETGVDAVSPGEVFLALEAGFPSDDVLYTGICARDDELQYLLDKGVIINADSLSQLERLLKVETPPALSVRINPNLGAGHHEHVITAGEMSKFGVHEEAALKAYKLAKIAGVKKFGIHMHIGSGVMDVMPFALAMNKLLNVARSVHENVGIDFDFADFGGGIGVPYKPEEKEVDMELFSEKLVGLFKEKIRDYSLGEPEFWLEPGRYLVAEAGIILTRINTIKPTSSRRFACIDAGFNTLIRPVLYGSYHHILVASKLDQPLKQEYDVVGPLCESGDILASGRLLPQLSEGDLLAILNTGAYGFSMNSQYNSRTRAAEVLVKEGHYELIREREDLRDLLRGQRIAGWLKD